MHFYLVAPTIRAHLEGYFTYQSIQNLAAGSLVLVEIGRRQSPAVVIKKVVKPSFETKPIIGVLHPKPLPPALLKTALWLEEYYASPISSVWQTLLPRGLAVKRRGQSPKNTESSIRQKPNFRLNTAQQQAIKAILKPSLNTTLLQGVTGSGKTAVYIELAQQVLTKDKKSVIVLVPEIALTSQLVAEFSHYFKDILLTHSGMSEAERHLVWLEALEATKPRLVIGPRSALFVPLARLGLIVIDEAHEPSFKQDQAPRYSALRTARVLADQHGARLVLGSATPSVSDRFLASKTASAIIRLNAPAKTPGAVDLKLIDSRLRNNFTRHRFFSNQLLTAIETTLDNHQQVLLFHNRRGSASSTMCEHCGWLAVCPHCFVPFVLHGDTFQLVCHVCGLKEKVPTQCPDCGHADVIHKGIGTKLIAEEIGKLFPRARVGRFDGDSQKSDGLDKNYKAIYEGAIDIIVGTQVVAKGLDLPKLAFVGVVQADGGLALPDFASEERVFQLLYQVMGRVGRDEKLSTIVIQSYQPDHPAIQAALHKNYEDFYTYTLAKRRHDHFPPFTHLLKITGTYKSEAAALKATNGLLQNLKKIASADVIFLGPAPAFYERARGTYRWQLILRSSHRQDLVDLLPSVPALRFQTDLDPISLL